MCAADVATQRQAAAQVDPDLMRHVPLKYDPEYLNPCWDDDGVLSCLPVSLSGSCGLLVPPAVGHGVFHNILERGWCLDC